MLFMLISKGRPPLYSHHTHCRAKQKIRWILVYSTLCALVLETIGQTRVSSLSCPHTCFTSMGAHALHVYLGNHSTTRSGTHATTVAGKVCLGNSKGFGTRPNRWSEASCWRACLSWCVFFSGLVFTSKSACVSLWNTLGPFALDPPDLSYTLSSEHLGRMSLYPCQGRDWILLYAHALDPKGPAADRALCSSSVRVEMSRDFSIFF